MLRDFRRKSFLIFSLIFVVDFEDDNDGEDPFGYDRREDIDPERRCRVETGHGVSKENYGSENTITNIERQR